MHKFFVSFADPVVNAVVFQNIPGEDRFSFIGFDAGWGDGVCCFWSWLLQQSERSQPVLGLAWAY